MANFLDFLTGGIQSTPEAPPLMSSPDKAPPEASTAGNPIRQGIEETAKALGISPIDLATAISYETAGTFDPTKAGPRTQWGQHRGLIQFGEPQAKEHGVDWNDPIRSQLGPDGAVASYLRKAGVQPGMGLLDVYSAINAGGVGRYGASDANNGGAPGTVRDKVEKQMAGHRAKAEALFGVEGSSPLNPAITAAAERGRGPAADRPARNAAMTEGQMPMPARPMADTTSMDSGGVLEFLRQQEGQSQSPVPAQAVGGLGGLGGFRVPGPSNASADPAPSLSPARSVESLIPAAPRDPFALFGPGAAKNQEWETERRGRVAWANELVRLGVDPQRAVDLSASPEATKLALSQIHQEKSAAANKEALGTLIGQPASPSAGPSAVSPQAVTSGQPAAPLPAYNPVQDKSLEGLNQTDRARMVAPLKVLMNPYAAKELKDVAEAQYKAVIDESKATPTTREYLIAKGQGFGGTLLEYKERLAKAGASNVSVDTRAENSEAKGRGEGLAKRWNDIADDGTKAGEDAILFQRFGEILSTVKTSKATETLEKVRQATGLKLDPNTDNVQALNAMINYIAPRLRVPGSGAQSDRELGNFLSSIPTLAGSPDGNKIILDTLSGFVGYRRQRAAIASEWQNGDISAKEAQKRVDAIPSPFTVQPKASAPAQPGIQPDVPPPPPSGQRAQRQTIVNPKTGERMILDGNQWVPLT